MIDLTGVTSIKHYYEETIEGNMLVTLSDQNDIQLGQFLIEKVRYRKFIETLSIIAKEIYNDLTPIMMGSRTTFDKASNLAISEF